MAKQAGITRYTCDRCHTAAYMLENDAHKGEWREIQHITADNTQNTYLLCASCWPLWHNLTINQDNDFNQFMTQTLTKE